MSTLSTLISAGGGAPAAPVPGTVKTIVTGRTSFGDQSGGGYIAIPAALDHTKCIVNCMTSSEHSYTYQGANARITRYNGYNELQITKTWGDRPIIDWSITEYV
mgnify:FL=1